MAMTIAEKQASAEDLSRAVARGMVTGYSTKYIQQRELLKSWQL